jgi:hypothetical protein
MWRQSTSDKLSGANATVVVVRFDPIQKGYLTSIRDVQSLATNDRSGSKSVKLIGFRS